MSRRLTTMLLTMLAACNPGPDEAPAATTDAIDSESTDSPTAQFAGPDLGADCCDCDIHAQDCPAGRKCAPAIEQGASDWNALRCVPVTGDGLAGAACTSEGLATGRDDCALAHVCLDLDDLLHGTCVALCTGDESALECPTGSVCDITSAAALHLCVTPCDPLAQNCPEAGLCIPDGPRFICAADASGDAGQQGDPCDAPNACDPGLLCLVSEQTSSACDPASPGCCAPLCKFPGAPCPHPDQQCTQWYDPAMTIPPGSQHIGVCVIPP